MTWKPYYQGDGSVRKVKLDPPPPWRRFPRETDGAKFQPPDGLVAMVNAALALRRPLLITGAPGSGKSTLIESVAAELGLGTVLRWHITSRSTLTDALYRYDVLGRIYAQQLKLKDDVALFLRLGPLGTALLPYDTPRALLIDEIDKGDLDLTGDLLDVLERGEYEIPELSRMGQDNVVDILCADDKSRRVVGGKVRCKEFPFIVMTSNGERDFPAPFLRRCIRFTMPAPTDAILRDIVEAHLGEESLGSETLPILKTFLAELGRNNNVATDQLLNAVFIVAGPNAPKGKQKEDLVKQLLRELGHG